MPSGNIVGNDWSWWQDGQPSQYRSQSCTYMGYQGVDNTACQETRTVLCVQRCNDDTCCKFLNWPNHDSPKTCFIDWTTVATSAGYWNIYYWGEPRKYSEAKAECASAGGSLVGQDAADEVKFVRRSIAH